VQELVISTVISAGNIVSAGISTGIINSSGLSSVISTGISTVISSVNLGIKGPLLSSLIIFILGLYLVIYSKSAQLPFSS